MSNINDETAGAVVTFVSGVLIGVAATLLFVRAQRNRSNCSKEYDDDYYYDGGDLFV